LAQLGQVALIDLQQQPTQPQQQMNSTALTVSFSIRSTSALANNFLM